eukprot:4651676-Alexandrium_andersonii.AAC.1
MFGVLLCLLLLISSSSIPVLPPRGASTMYPFNTPAHWECIANHPQGLDEWHSAFEPLPDPASYTFANSVERTRAIGVRPERPR